MAKKEEIIEKYQRKLNIATEERNLALCNVYVFIIQDLESIEQPNVDIEKCVHELYEHFDIKYTWVHKNNVDKTANLADMATEITKYEQKDKIKSILIKHLTSKAPTAEEMNKRDCDLADIFNTSKDNETKGDLYMRIIEYLVNKGFLQKGEPQEKTDMEKCIEEVRNVRINREQEVKVDKVEIEEMYVYLGKKDTSTIANNIRKIAAFINK